MPYQEIPFYRQNFQFANHDREIFRQIPGKIAGTNFKGKRIFLPFLFPFGKCVGKKLFCHLLFVRVAAYAQVSTVHGRIKKFTPSDWARYRAEPGPQAIAKQAAKRIANSLHDKDGTICHRPEGSQATDLAHRVSGF